MEDNSYQQICVLRGVSDSLDDLSKLIPETFDVRVQMLDEFRTRAGQGGEGGRRDVLFLIHADDISKFAVPRLEYGISWWEDYLANSKSIVPPSIKKKYPKEW